ncbi:YidC/Oxa1 family membrane protein insertase [Candidatus Xianfuyuplasma coldseepsis]|uniref:YidC/Oxa1 family membrane protein insertase n=1 Tax=Candidatus Xianfuyuplasma coldseepsis TaxID=2782163 RepID=A0A7L7KRQ1_9MOLU|nr:YidC/Oxa1 family membrane protein insertase [Xianfuyuplasma coldseepsis]QMS84942.1 YidC/Oxa1 family membrane protein insertase [Xianfuyuplasma coldseepsis]
MNRKKRVLLIAMTLLLVVALSACSNGGTSMYEQPIGAEGGWGWLQWIISQIAEFTFWVSTQLGGNYWIGLVVVTLIVRSAGWPIYSKSNAMTLNMQQAQPELNKIQEKYKGRTDELSQKKMQQETLEVYKKYNINPLGCLLPFLQMPIFIAMYQVVRRLPLSVGGAEGLKDYSSLNYSFLGIDLKAGVDFTVFGNVPFFDAVGSLFPEIILAILVGVLMFGYQKYAQSKPDYLQNKKYQTKQAQQTANQMKYMSYFMVFMLVSIAITNNGIALYWVVGNSFQFFQTWVNRRQQYKKFLESKDVVKSV